MNYHAVVESAHDIQNPSSREKIALLGARLGLDASSSVVDLASGRAGPALVLAETTGCHITCVEHDPDFHDAATQRVSEAGLGSLIEPVQADAAEFPLADEAYDVAICLGASFVWDGLVGCLRALAPCVKRGGFVVVGEPYWRVWPLPEETAPDWQDEYTTLPATVNRFEEAELSPVLVIDASHDDWDRYETLQWRTGEEWLAEHPEHPDATEIRDGISESRDAYLTWQRDLLGWAILAGRKR